MQDKHYQSLRGKMPNFSKNNRKMSSQKIADDFSENNSKMSSQKIADLKFDE